MTVVLQIFYLFLLPDMQHAFFLFFMAFRLSLLKEMELS